MVQMEENMRMFLFPLFICYSTKDERLKDELLEHLSPLRREGIISDWHFRKITAGKEWQGQIDQHMKKARIILLLVSTSFVDSDYCYDTEMNRAMQRHEKGEARVIPIILRPVDWHKLPFSKLEALPKDGKPVTTWTNRDEAFLDVEKGIRKVCHETQDIPTANRPPDLGNAEATSLFCRHCGARPGEQSNCTGVFTGHDFRPYKGDVFCRHCGARPGKRSLCTGVFTGHDFRAYKG
jgi:hypothetical protein